MTLETHRSVTSTMRCDTRAEMLTPPRRPGLLDRIRTFFRNLNLLNS